MPTLSSIASAGPFVGLFGTVYGIMDAFLRIGQEKSASLPVVAPAIGEALIATAIGLFAAIPAVIAYNAINKRIEDLLAELEASSEGWVAIAARPRARCRSTASPAPAGRAAVLRHGMAASCGKKRGGFNDINVTPLVDVMLVLLVVFMVTAPLLTAGAPRRAPERGGPRHDRRRTPSSSSPSRKDERILFGEDDVDGEHRGRARSRTPRVQKEKELYIRADKNARYGAVARVVAAARAAGVEGLNLLVEPEPKASKKAEAPEAK